MMTARDQVRLVVLVLLECAVACSPTHRTPFPVLEVPDTPALRARIESLYTSQQKRDGRAIWAMFPPSLRASSDVTASDLEREMQKREFEIISFRINAIHQDQIPHDVPNVKAAAAVDMDVWIQHVARK